MSDFKAEMHQNRWWLGLRPRPHWGSLQRSPRPPSWIQGILLLRGGRGREGRGGYGRELVTHPNVLPYFAHCSHVRRPKIWGILWAHPLGLGVWLTPRNMLLLTLSCQIWSFWVKPHEGDLQIRQKNSTPRILPFKVTQGNWNSHELISYL